jgi:CheY-like chemotaxis protein
MARVLVVDDSEDLQETLSMALSDEGFAVSSALDGKRGLELTGELRPDVILLDMMMPEMDGLEFLSVLARRPSPPPVVAQSGFHHLRSEALRRGAHSFLAKPFSMATLVGALGAAVASRPVAAALIARNAAEVEHARRLALEGSARALAELGPLDPGLRDGLRRVPRWLTGYFGFGTAEVTFLDPRGLYTAAIDGARLGLAEGKTVPLEDALCDEVIAAGSTLLVEDPARHPSARIARHRQVLAGWNFYAGVPLRMDKGPAIGTVCLEDTSPHEFHGEDMRVLEALARGLGRGLETRSWPIDGVGALQREYLDVFIETASTRVARSGAVVAAMTVDATTPVPRATGLAAIRLDESRILLLWSGRAVAWSPPETIEGHVLARPDLARVHDGVTAREELRALCR